MARIRRVDCSGPGIRRRRRGRSFSYEDPAGQVITDPEVLARLRGLAIPPAWKDVWICPIPTGHLQAVGTDAAGRFVVELAFDASGRIGTARWLTPPEADMPQEERERTAT